MLPKTDDVRHGARLARKNRHDGAPGGEPSPNAEHFKVLARSVRDITQGREKVRTAD